MGGVGELMMNALVFNCGSSSLKYRLISMPEEKELAGGEAQRVGPRTAEPPRIVHRSGGKQEILPCDMPDHAAAFERVMELLTRDPALVPDAIGHRMVHGGEVFRDHAVVDASVISLLEGTLRLAPLHNPPAFNLLKVSQDRYPDLPQTVVFDTVYHASMPDYAYTYALPRRLRKELGIRKYGFHGTSHRFVAGEAAAMLGITLDELDAVSCHLGSGGASLCAVVGGKSVDNTMGYSPLQGLMMSTRCGDIDPSTPLVMLAQKQGDCDAVEKSLNKASGVLGMSGFSSDIRDVFARLDEAGDSDARLELTRQTYLWRIRKYLGAYLAVVGRARAVIFTDTIGETSPEARWAVCADMDAFGLRLDRELNANAHKLPADVAARDSAVRALVIRTNEELAIARETFRMLACRPTNCFSQRSGL